MKSLWKYLFHMNAKKGKKKTEKKQLCNVNKNPESIPLVFVNLMWLEYSKILQYLL